MPPTSLPQPTLIVGREREWELLSGLLADVADGHGALVLVSGAAGIGKTTLVRALSVEVVTHGCTVLTGSCYDLGTPPLYGPWRELVGSTTRRRELPPAPRLLWDQADIVQVPTADAFVVELRTYLEALVEHGPVTLVLEDLHWADHESLEFLRVFARQVSGLPLLLIATYRDDELAPSHTLYQLLPHLVRESNAHRITIPALGQPAIRALVEARYGLPRADADRLVAHLEERSQGIPFYLQELLRSYEEEQRLRRIEDGWTLGALDHTSVPLLIRQVIDGRLARLDPEVRRLLELAAVIGPEVPRLLWQRVGSVNEERFTETVEHAVNAHVLEAAPPGLNPRFTHALVRETLYAGISLPRRQLWHRLVAEALAGASGCEPGMVAHHFRQALDPRAVSWLIEAGSRAERVAWLTAADYFGMALDMLSADTDPAMRGWLLVRRAKLLRSAQPRMALAILETAADLAAEAQDDLLLAYVTFFRGQNRSLAGELRHGISDLEESVAALARLSPADLQRLDELVRQGVVLSREEVAGLLAGVLAVIGRISEAMSIADAIIEGAEETPIRAWWARGIALALAGRASEASQAFTTCHAVLRSAADAATATTMLLYRLVLVQLPYRADELAERRRVAEEAAAAWRQSVGAYGEVSPRFAHLPLLQLEGDWEAARELALSATRSSDVTSETRQIATLCLAHLAQRQGQPAQAWAWVHELLPAGPQAVPGDHADLAEGLALIRLAVTLCLERGDLPAAHAWLAAHERWLAGSGAILGQAQGQLAWAAYWQVAGDFTLAVQRARHALVLAGEPRQPLELLSAHRLVGELETHAGRLREARQQLETALLLADACAAPFERALTLLALAELQMRSGTPESASRMLDEAVMICTPLGAQPTLARAAALAARIAEQATAASRTAPAGLSPRELEVLRLLAAGRSSREIAEILFLSARTVERHITNLYTKIDAHNRSEAIAFAYEHGLV